MNRDRLRRSSRPAGLALLAVALLISSAPRPRAVGQERKPAPPPEVPAKVPAGVPAEAPAEASAEVDRERQVRDFITAFNARDLERILQSVEEDVRWLSIDGDRLKVEAKGREGLEKSLAEYFTSCPSCSSSLEWVRTVSDRVVALERASWTGREGPASQTSLSVYEFGEMGIMRVYYFPAED